MSDLRELYQEIILDHNRSPRNFRKMEEADRVAEGYNPLCGDHYKIYMKLDGEKISEIAFEGSGCAISKASTSVMTQTLKGKTKREAGEIVKNFRAMVTGESEAEESAGKLAAFAGVAEHPSRVKCAVLSWHTVNSALTGEEEVVSTE